MGCFLCGAVTEDIDGIDICIEGCLDEEKITMEYVVNAKFIFEADSVEDAADKFWEQVTNITAEVEIETIWSVEDF